MQPVQKRQRKGDLRQSFLPGRCQERKQTLAKKNAASFKGYSTFGWLIADYFFVISILDISI